MKYTLEDQHIGSYGFLYLSLKTPNGEQTPFHAPTTLSNKNSRNSYLNNVGQKLTPSFFQITFFICFTWILHKWPKVKAKAMARESAVMRTTDNATFADAFAWWLLFPPSWLLPVSACLLPQTPESRESCSMSVGSQSILVSYNSVVDLWNKKGYDNFKNQNFTAKIGKTYALNPTTATSGSYWPVRDSCSYDEDPEGGCTAVSPYSYISEYIDPSYTEIILSSNGTRITDKTFSLYSYVTVSRSQVCDSDDSEYDSSCWTHV